MRWVAAVVACAACGRLGFDPHGTPSDGGDIDGNGLPDGQQMGWFDPAYPNRYQLVIANPLATDMLAQPIFVRATMLTGGPGPMRESAIRVVELQGQTNVEIPFAVHDWDPAGGLDDADGDLDDNDELLFLVDLPASGTREVDIYYDTVDHKPASWPTRTVARTGSGFPSVAIDGAVADAGALTFSDGTRVLTLQLVDSIPFYNASGFTYDSSRLGPRIDDVTLPDGTPVYKTVLHTGPPAGNLTHTVRLGPVRLNGGFQNVGGDNIFYQPHLVAASAHSRVLASSRPLAAVVAIEAELACTAGTGCNGDVGDVEIVGYLFDRGNQNEVVTRWRVRAAMDGTHTITTTPTTDGEENYDLVGYMIEEYAEPTYPQLVDIDTVRLNDGTASTALKFNPGPSMNDRRATVPNTQFGLMTDTDAPYTGTLAILPEQPLTGFFWDDGAQNAVLGEPNGYQSQWGLTAPSFNTWGAATDTVSYAYWMVAYPHPQSGADDVPASQAARALRTPPTFTTTYQHAP